MNSQCYGILPRLCVRAGRLHVVELRGPRRSRSRPGRNFADAAHGAALFTANCARCHGATGREGGFGPSLTNESRKVDTEFAIAWIKNPNPPMPKLYPSRLSKQDVA